MLTVNAKKRRGYTVTDMFAHPSLSITLEDNGYESLGNRSDHRTSPCRLCNKEGLDGNWR